VLGGLLKHGCANASTRELAYDRPPLGYAVGIQPVTLLKLPNDDIIVGW
jgi:hypothetical protein